METEMPLSRRATLLGLAGLPMLALPRRASAAATVREITWEDLIPPGVPYSEIVGEGAYDEANDTWLPVFDDNARAYNRALDGVRVKLPGYVIPLEQSSAGIREFIYAPYAGACIHVPPPPPNQLVFVTSPDPWEDPDGFGAVWVTGVLRIAELDTNLARIGYEMTAETIEIYEF